MRRSLLATLAATLPLLTCGGRTELGVPRREAAPPVCTPSPRPAAHCTAWVAGTAQALAPAPGTDFAWQLGGAVRSGCGALVAWSTAKAAGPGAAVWTTRQVGFDGAPLAAAITHPDPNPSGASSSPFSFAWNGSHAGLLVTDVSGCHLLTLDQAGHDAGPVLSLGAGSCLGLAAHGAGWSFLRPQGDGESTPVALAVVDAAGHEVDTDLPAASQQVVWDRLVFDDGSFLLDTFREDSTTTQYADWLTPFEASGAALGPRVKVEGFDSAPVWLVATPQGALSAWSWDGLWVRPVDRKGAPAGPPHQVISTHSIYEMTLLPVPDGDVLLAWKELGGGGDLSTYAMALAPDGAPRGPATLLAGDVETTRVYGAVEQTGGRAVLVSNERAGIEAIPLTCKE